jgi:riboflavin biosynthesis pyrimidine reductase
VYPARERAGAAIRPASSGASLEPSSRTAALGDRGGAAASRGARSARAARPGYGPAMRDRERPYVVCHMVPSVDGRIVIGGWKLPGTLLSEYERTAATFDADAWIIGRVSMEPYAGRARIPARAPRARLPRTDFVARADAPSYAIAIDPSGKLRWESAAIDGEHVVAVLSGRVPDRYLAFLRSKGVSYLFGGSTRIDVPAVLRKLRSRFGIRKLLLEGGGKINGSFLAADAIDELSLLVAPVADGGVGTPTLFDAGEGARPARHLRLLSVKRRRGGLLWVRYAVGRRGRRPAAP